MKGSRRLVRAEGPEGHAATSQMPKSVANFDVSAGSIAEFAEFA
jgi:hypothetical protein